MHVDSVFINARIYNVFLKQWTNLDVAVLAGKVLYMGDAAKAGIIAEKVFDCKNKSLIPGFIDIHLHIESSLCVPGTFASAVLPHGVMTVIAEPHEMANVFGLSGVEEMIRASREAEIDIFYSVPSSVPSTRPELETTGGVINSEDMEILMRRYPEVICLGEVMNYSSLIGDFAENISDKAGSKIISLISQVQQKYPLAAIEGHCPSVRDLDLSKLLYLGIDSDHCLQDVEGMRQRFANGMFVEIQEKSITPEIISYLQNNDVDGLYSFVTDDVAPDILENKGHLDYLVNKAMKNGLSLEKVIIATSLAPAKRMGFRDRGTISPGKLADFILLEEHPSEFKINSVYKHGMLYNSETRHKTIYKFDQKFFDSFNVPAVLSSDKMYTLRVTKELKNRKTVKCRIIRKNSKNTYTESVIRSLPLTRGTINWANPGLEVNLIIVIDRFSGFGNTAQGLLDGVRIRGGSFCTSHAHDHHNILLIGDNIRDMEKALNWVLTQKGGMCTASKGEILASVQLPVGGILSEAPMKELASDVKSVQQSLHNLGIDHANPIMSMCTLTLPVSPELKITDKGLVDVHNSKIVPLFIE